MDELDHRWKETSEETREMLHEIRGVRTWTRKRIALALVSVIGLIGELVRCVYMNRDFEQVLHFGYRIIHDYFNCSNGDRI